MARERGFGGLERILRNVTTADRPSDPDAALLRAAADGDADAVAVRPPRGRRHRGTRRARPHGVAARRDLRPGRRSRGCWWRWGPTPTPSTTGTTRPGWSPASPEASRCSRRCCRPTRTSPIRNRFGGLSPIPASERGHVDYVRRVVQTGIDIDHVNNLGWTALLEAVILGDGGQRHQEIVRILLAAAPTGRSPTATASPRCATPSSAATTRSLLCYAADGYRCGSPPAARRW